MKVSRAKMAENRALILREACRLFQEKGFEGVTVAEVMHAAGLTHGGFYGHFRSKDDLITQMLEARCQLMVDTPTDIDLFLNSYLSTALCDDPTKGCHIPSLAADISRQTPEARRAMTDSIRVQITKLGALGPDSDAAQQRRLAITQWAAMVGAGVLARASDDRDLAEEILTDVRAFVEDGLKPK